MYGEYTFNDPTQARVTLSDESRVLPIANEEKRNIINTVLSFWCIHVFLTDFGETASIPRSFFAERPWVIREENFPRK